MLVILVCLLYGLAINDKLPIDYDNGSYAVLAQSLAGGRGYALTNFPDARPHTFHPFLYPLILAGVYKAAGMSLVAFKAVSAISAILSLVFLVILFKDRLNPALLIPAFLVSAVNPHFLTYSHQILSDIPFVAASFAALIFIEKYARSEKVFSVHLFICILLVTVSFYLRIVGLLLLAGAALYLFFEKRNLKAFLKSILLFVPSGVLIALFFLRNRFIVGAPGNEMTFFLKDVFNPEAGTITAADLLNRMAANFAAHLKTFSLWVVGNDLLAENFLFIVIAVFILLGLLFCIVRCRRCTEYFFIVYLLALIFWVTPDKRYLLPLLPLAVVYFLKGFEVPAEYVLNNLKKPLMQIAVLIFSIALIFAAVSYRKSGGTVLGIFSLKYAIFLLALWLLIVFVNVAAVAGYVKLLRGLLFGGVMAALLVSNGILAVEYARMSHTPDFYKQPEREYVQAAQWIKENTTEDALVLCDMPTVMYLLCDRKTLDVPLTSDLEIFEKVVRDNKVDYIFLDNLSPSGATARYLMPFTEKHAGMLPPLETFGDSRLFKVKN